MPRRIREAAADRVPGAGDVEHRGDRAHAVARLPHEPGRRAVESELGGRELARPELVLEPVDAQVRRPAAGVAGLDVEERQPRPPGGLPSGRASVSAIWAAIAEVNHLRPQSRQPPVVGRRARHGLGEADVGAAGALGHPLAAGPEALRVAGGQARHGALDQRPLAAREEGVRGAVGHRQRAAIDVGRGGEEVDERELVEAREPAVAPLVGRRDHAALGGEPLGAAPERRHLDLVDALAPGAPSGSAAARSAGRRAARR